MIAITGLCKHALISKIAIRLSTSFEWIQRNSATTFPKMHFVAGVRSNRILYLTRFVGDVLKANITDTIWEFLIQQYKNGVNPFRY